MILLLNFFKTIASKFWRKIDEGNGVNLSDGYAEKITFEYN